MTDEELIARLRSSGMHHTDFAADRIEALGKEIVRLKAVLDDANEAVLKNAYDLYAAEAAAYEVAAQAVNDRGAREQANFSLDRATQNFFRARDLIRTLATPEQTAALDRVRAEAKAEGMREAADLLREQGYNTAVHEILAAIPKGN